MIGRQMKVAIDELACRRRRDRALGKWERVSRTSRGGWSWPRGHRRVRRDRPHPRGIKPKTLGLQRPARDSSRYRGANDAIAALIPSAGTHCSSWGDWGSARELTRPGSSAPTGESWRGISSSRPWPRAGQLLVAGPGDEIDS